MKILNLESLLVTIITLKNNKEELDQLPIDEYGSNACYVTYEVSPSVTPGRSGAANILV